MSRSRAAVSIAILIASRLALPLDILAQPGVREWSVNNTDAMNTGTEYELYNGTRQIGYDQRAFGVNLGWVGHSGGYFEFRRWAPRGTTSHLARPIDPAEDVALWSSKAQRYLVYQTRGDTEAELGWSRDPVYQWHAEGQNPRNGRVYFALYNNKVKKYLVSQQKNYGIGLGWYNNSPPAEQGTSVTLTAQPIIQGWVPYLGTFGGNTLGNLLSVQNPSQTATLMFLKRPNGTEKCGDPSATVRVAPLAKMTAAQMDTLYGSPTPRLPIAFLACIATSTPQNISLTFINITYKLDH